MKIDSGLSSYNYQSRSSDIERRPEEAALRESDTPKRTGSFTVESSTLLSTSLANALWMANAPEAGRGTAASMPPAPKGEEWVAERYREFSEF
jgi:hypothetical protein